MRGGVARGAWSLVPLVVVLLLGSARCEPPLAGDPSDAADSQDVRSILSRITNFVAEGTARDKQVFDHVSAVCSAQSQPLEEKVQLASQRLGAIKAEIKQQQGVQQQSVVSGDLTSSISTLKENVSKLRARLDSLDELHKAVSDQWEEHEREIAGSVKMLSPFVREYDQRESTDPTRQVAPSASALIELRASGSEEVPVRGTQRTSGSGDSLLLAQQSTKPAGRQWRPAVRFRRVASGTSDAPQGQDAQAEKPLLSVSTANAELLQELKAIQQRLLSGRPSQESFRSDRDSISPQVEQAEARLHELEAKRDALVKADKNATAAIAQLEKERKVAQAQTEQLEAQLGKTSATCGLYLHEFEDREQDRVRIGEQVQKLKAQAMAVVNNILDVKVGDTGSDCCPCAVDCTQARPLCQHCLQ